MNRSLVASRITFPIFLVAWLLVTNCDADSVIEEVAYHPQLYVEVDKSDQRLRLRHGNTTYREYPIAFGRGGRGGKQRLGDNKTPEGIYRIVGINESDRFHLFLRLNYPNVKDAFLGLKNKTISRDEFDQILMALTKGRLPPQNTALGGAIGIHGVGEENAKKLRIHANMNWTEGCIALTNSEVMDLMNFVGVGTEVVIQE